MQTARKLWDSFITRWIPTMFPGFTKESEEEIFIAAVKESLIEWKNAKEQFDHAGPALIDYMVYRLNAAERHYIALLSMAKEQGLNAWPEALAEPVKNPEFALNNNPEEEETVILLEVAS